MDVKGTGKSIFEKGVGYKLHPETARRHKAKGNVEIPTEEVRTEQPNDEQEQENISGDNLEINEINYVEHEVDGLDNSGGDLEADT